MPAALPHLLTPPQGKLADLFVSVYVWDGGGMAPHQLSMDLDLMTALLAAEACLPRGVVGLVKP